jgi:hypothetical protein
MASQNRIVAASKIASLLTGSVRMVEAKFFRQIDKLSIMTKGEKTSTSIEKIGPKQFCDESIQHSDSMSVDFLLVKMCAKSISNHAQKIETETKRFFFSTIREFSKRKSVLEKL